MILNNGENMENKTSWTNHILAVRSYSQWRAAAAAGSKTCDRPGLTRLLLLTWHLKGEQFYFEILNYYMIGSSLAFLPVTQLKLLLPLSPAWK